MKGKADEQKGGMVRRERRGKRIGGQTGGGIRITLLCLPKTQNTYPSEAVCTRSWHIEEELDLSNNRVACGGGIDKAGQSMV